MENEVWISLVGIEPRNKSTFLGEAKGAYTNVLLWANSQDDYLIKLKTYLDTNNINLIEIEDAETFSDRVSKYEVEEKLYYLAEVVKSKGNPQIGTIHTFENNEM